MKQKTTIWAIICLIIAGLLITSAAGIRTTPSFNESKQTTEPKREMQIQNVLDAIQQGNLDDFQVYDKSKAQLSYVAVVSMQAEQRTILVDSVEPNYNLVSRQKVEGNRNIGIPQLVRSYLTHPAFGDADDGNLLLGYEWDYQNFTNPQDPIDIEAVVWQGHNYYGDDPEAWCDGLYWIHDNGEPVDVSYPTVDYWGINASTGNNQWFATMVGEEAPFNDPRDGQWYNGTNVTIMRCVGDPCDNESYSLRIWTGFGDDFYDMSMADIACTDGLEFPVNKSLDPFGICSYIMTNSFGDPPDYPVVQGCHFFKPIEYQGENRYGLMSWYLELENCEGTSCYLDPETTNGYAVWDPYCALTEDPVVRGRLMTHYGRNFGEYGFQYPDHPDFDSGGWIHWLQDETLRLKNPTIASNNGAVVAATEVHNLSNPNEVMVSFWYDNSTSGDVGGNFTISGIWYIDEPGGGKILYPEITHVQGHTFLCSFVVEGDLLFTISYDDGFTWSSDWYFMTQDFLPVAEYRTMDYADAGSFAIWEHEVDLDNTILIYRANTVTYEGNCDIMGGFPATLESVEIINQETERSLFADVMDDYYMRKLILGIDTWINETDPLILRFIATDVGPFRGTVDHPVTAIDYVNTIDITLYPLITIIGARSCITHGDAGEFCLDLINNNDNHIEPRLPGISLIEFDLSGSVSTVDASVSCLIDTGYDPTITITYIDADTIRVGFDPPLPDIDVCTITLSGDADDSFLVRTLAGDIDLSKGVTGGDALIIKPHLGEFTDSSNFVFDFDASGTITGADYSLIKPRLENISPG